MIILVRNSICHKSKVTQDSGLYHWICSHLPSVPGSLLQARADGKLVVEDVGADERDLGEELQLLVEVGLQLCWGESLSTDRTAVEPGWPELCKCYSVNICLVVIHFYDSQYTEVRGVILLPVGGRVNLQHYDSQMGETADIFQYQEEQGREEPAVRGQQASPSKPHQVSKENYLNQIFRLFLSRINC